MKILENLVKIFLVLAIIYCSLYFTCIYKDEILSRGSRRNLKGKIAYSLSGLHIKIIELSSGEKRNIYSVSKEEDRYLGFVLDPYFSPDGRRIVFSKMDDPQIDFRHKLYLFNSNGTNLKKLLELPITDLLSPSWSPDGKKIAFIAKPSDVGGIYRGLYIVDIENPSSITLVSKIMQPSSKQPSWSPDSKQLAFISDEYIRGRINEKWRYEIFAGRLFLVNIDGIDSMPVIGASEVAWSPDGKTLVCKKADGYYIVDIDEKQTYPSYRLISYKKPFFGIGGSFPVRWSPDGKYIVFCKEIWPGVTGIYVASIDNPEKHIRIATEDEDIIGMSWAE